MASFEVSSPLDENLRLLLQPLKTLVVVGGNWGDEGKGKIIDKVLSHYDVAARFSGGANAGHTVKTPEGVTVVSHLIPCGLAQNKTCVLGRGEFIDLKLFIEEFKTAGAALQGNMPAIYIDEMSPLWTPYHALLEAWLELSRDGNVLGTTGKGIGPLEGLYKLRISPVVGHLSLPKEQVVKILRPLYQAFLPCFESLKKISSEVPVHIPEPGEVADQLLALRSQINVPITDTSFFLSEILQKGERVLFEGAQALGLDSHWGTYPYVSSGNSAAAGAAIGTGLPMDAFAGTLMVAKTLPTRVGRGPFPSEIWERVSAEKFAKENPQLFTAGSKRDAFLKTTLAKINAGQAKPEEWSQYFQVLGDERGATTGRGRSVGFLDVPWLLYAIRINNPKMLALTRFDMLSGVKSIPVVVGYKLRGENVPLGKLPAPWEMPGIEAVKENWPGFEEDISGISNFKDLPQSAQNFIIKLEQMVKVPLAFIGTGPGREAIIVRA